MQQKPPLATRLQVRDAEVMPRYTSADLIAAAREKLPEMCELEDRTKGLPTDGSNMMALIKFLSDAVGDAEAGGGRKLIYIQRTAENKDGFCSTFALVKYAETVTQTTDPIRFAAPGWIAWCRDDYFFASSSYDLTLACRVLLGFAAGSSECCICLESMFEERPSIGLDCGHIIHEECLQKALSSVGQSPTCPLCRTPFQVKRDGTISAVCPPAQAQAAASRTMRANDPGFISLDVLDLDSSDDVRRGAAADGGKCCGCCALM